MAISGHSKPDTDSAAFSRNPLSLHSLTPGSVADVRGPPGHVCDADRVGRVQGTAEESARGDRNLMVIKPQALVNRVCKARSTKSCGAAIQGPQVWPHKNPRKEPYPPPITLRGGE